MNIFVKGLEPRMNIEYKEAKIREALMAYFSESELNSIMKYWHHYYSKEPAFVLRRFVTEICQTPEQQAAKKQIVKDIFLSLNQVAGKTSENNISNIQLCFEAYLFDVLQLLPENHEAFILTLKRKLSVSKSHHNYKNEFFYINFWLNDVLNLKNTQSIQFKHIASDISLPAIQIVCSQAYVVLCDMIGPIEADHLIQTAIKKRYEEGQTDEIHQITQV